MKMKVIYYDNCILKMLKLMGSEKKGFITLKFIAIAANAENRFAARKNLIDFL